MEHLEKYEKFRTFCATIPSISSNYILALQTCPFELFILAIKNKGDMPIEEIIKDAIEKANIDLTKIPEDIQQKFKRYLQYFILVSKIL